MEIRTVVYNSVDSEHVCMVIVQEGLDGSKVYQPRLEDGIVAWGWVEYSTGDNLVPSMVLPRVIADGVLQDIANELDRNFEIRATAEQGSKGELEATQRHLEDMRTIIFDSDEIVLGRTKEGK